MKKIVIAALLLCAAAAYAAPKSHKKEQPKGQSALDKYIEQASQPDVPNTESATTGSLWTPAAWFSDLAADQRARRVDDIVRYRGRSVVTDILIRDVPDKVVAAIELRASQLGLSRNEYLRRQLSKDAARSQASVRVADLERFGELFGDLADAEVMKQAWS